MDRLWTAYACGRADAERGYVVESYATSKSLHCTPLVAVNHPAEFDVFVSNVRVFAYCILFAYCSHCRIANCSGTDKYPFSDIHR